MWPLALKKSGSYCLLYSMNKSHRKLTIKRISLACKVQCAIKALWWPIWKKFSTEKARASAHRRSTWLSCASAEPIRSKSMEQNFPAFLYIFTLITFHTKSTSSEVNRLQALPNLLWLSKNDFLTILYFWKLLLIIYIVIN